MADNPFADLIPQGGSQQGTTNAVATTFGYNDPEDNGVGAWGDITNRPDVYGVSLPIPVLRQQFGNENKAHGQLVKVINPDTGKSIVAPIIDKGPADWVVQRQGNTIDLTHATNEAIGGTGKTPVKYEFVGGQQQQDPFADLIPKSEEPSQNMGQGFVSDQSSNPYADLIPSQTPAGFGSAPVSTGSPQTFGSIGASISKLSSQETTQPQQEIDNPIENALRNFASSAATTTLNSIGGAVRYFGGAQQKDLKMAQDELAQAKASGASQDQIDEIQGRIDKFNQQIPEVQNAAKSIADLSSQYPAAYGVSPEDKSVSAQIGRGLGGVTAMIPSMATGPAGMALGALQGASQAYEETYQNAIQRLQSQGMTDQALIDDQAQKEAAKAAVKTAPSLAAYLVGGKLASEGVSKLLSTQTPLIQGIAGAIAGSVANTAAGATIRKFMGESAMPTPESLTQDIAFGLFHGIGTGVEAQEKLRQLKEEQERINKQTGGPAPEVAPSSNPIVNQREEQILALADAQAPVPQTPVAETPVINLEPVTPSATAPSADINALIAEQLFHEEGSPEHTAIQQQIDALTKPAEAPVAEAQPTEENAIQEQGAREVGVRNAPTVGEGVGAENQPEEVAPQAEAPKEEVITPNTLEEAKTIEEVDAYVKAQKGFWGKSRMGLDEGTRQRALKALGMQSAARKRQITGNLTAKEAASKARREASNYIGKPVSVDGKNGTIVGNPYGRVKVRFSDGTESTHLPEKIQAPLEITETKPEAPVEEKPQEEVVPSNPYDAIQNRYYEGGENAFKSHEELGNAVADIAKKQKNKTLQEAVVKYREALDLGDDAGEAANKLMEVVSQEADYHDQGGRPKSEKVKPAKRETSGGYFGATDPIIQYLQENPILSKTEYERRVKSGKVTGGGGEYDDAPPINRGHASQIYSPKGRMIDQIHSELIDQGLMSPDSSISDLWNHIDRASQNAIKLAKEESSIAKSQTEKAKAEKFSKKENDRLEKLKATDPDKYQEERGNDLKEWFEANRRRGEGGFIELPEGVKEAATKFGEFIYKAGMSFRDWSGEMIKRLGEGVGGFLRRIYHAISTGGGRFTERGAERGAVDISGDERFKPKAPTEQEAFAKKAIDAFVKNTGKPPTEEQMSQILSRKFPGITSREASDLYATSTGKPKPPAPYAGVAATQGQTPFGISETAQQRMVESGELTHVSPSAEPVSQQDRLEKAEQALDSGADPEQVIRDLQAANIPDKIAQGMVFANKLKNAASEALSKYGYNSPEFKEAQKAHQDYQDRLKEAGTSQAGSALNIVGAGAKLNEARLTDPYDFANAFHDQTKGQDMTLSQIDKASKLAERNKKAEETTKKAQEDLSTIRDEGFSNVDVKTPETLEEAREQVGDLANIESKKSREEIDRVNNELERTKKELEDLKQSLPKNVDELRSNKEQEISDLKKQLEETEKQNPLVKRIMDRVSSSLDSQYEQAIKRIRQRQREGRLFTGVDPSSLPDNIIVGAYHLKNAAGDFAKWSSEVVKTLGEAIKPHLKKLWENSNKKFDDEVDKTGLAGASTVKKTVRKATSKAKPVEKMTPAEKAADSLRKRIARSQKVLDDINSGKISKPKEVEKVTNDEIKALEDEYNQKRKEVADAKLKAKQKELFPKGDKITGNLNIEQAKTLWESAKKFYIPRMTEDPFYDEHRLVSDIADDFGLSHQQVRDAFAMPKGAKKAANNLLLEQQKRKQVLDNSRRWLIDQSSSMIGKLFGKAAEQAFKLSVLGHGTAFITTHALPLWLTHPVLGTKAFLRAMRYTFTGKSGRTQWIIDNHDIVNHPDYEWAIKGGADVNPFRYGTEKPQRSNPDSLLAKALDPITGGRGFDALHWMRMQYFSKEWRKLSPAMQNEEMAKVIGDAVNTATGYSESKFGSHPIVRLALFAPKLYKSQFKWLIGDPARMLGTVGRMAIGRDVSPADAWQARHEAVNKAKFIGMYAGALGLNALILKAIGSNAQINFTDPKKHDWLAFKTNDGSFNPLHPFIAIGRLLAKETHDLFSDYAPSVFGKKTPLEKSTGNNVKLAAHDLADYAFSKLSPIARDAAVLVNQRDFAGNAVPWSSIAPLRGKEKLTWPQFLAGMFAPIPFAEASSQKEWLSPGAGEKLGSALIFGVPYETREDEERWAKSHAAKTRGGSSSASSRGNQ